MIGSLNKKVKLLFFFLPLIGIGQDRLSFNEIIDINSKEQFQKVTIENDFLKTDLRDDVQGLVYGYGFEKETEKGETWAVYYADLHAENDVTIGEHTVDFEFVFGSDEVYVLPSSVFPNHPKRYTKDENFLRITGKIKRLCDFHSIEEFTNFDIIYYNCSLGKFQGLIGYYTLDNQSWIIGVHKRE